MENNTHPVVVRFYNANKNSWRFPDGEVISSVIKASEKAKQLGMVLEGSSGWRFSKSH